MNIDSYTLNQKLNSLISRFEWGRLATKAKDTQYYDLVAILRGETPAKQKSKAPDGVTTWKEALTDARTPPQGIGLINRLFESNRKGNR